MFAASLLPLALATTAPASLAIRDLAPFSSLDEKVREVAPTKTVACLAKRLAALAPTPIKKARAAYVWTTSHIAYSLQGRPGPDATLITGNGDCDAHALFFAALCSAMNVECTKVTGHLRFPYAPGAALAGYAKPLAKGQWLVSHAWNAVRIDGQWGLVDATLGTPDGDVEADDYFLPDPAVLATDHVPDEPLKALVAEPSLAEIAKTPILRPCSWRMGIAAGDLVAKPGADVSRVEIPLAWKRDLRVSLQTDAGIVEDAVLVQPTTTGTEIRLCSPKAGAVAWLGLGSGTAWHPLAGYPVSSASEHHMPTLMTPFYDTGASLQAPFERDLPAGRVAEIRLRAPGALRVVAFQGPEVAGMFVRDGDTWVLRTTPTSGPALQIMASYEDRNHFRGLLAYKVR